MFLEWKTTHANLNRTQQNRNNPMSYSNRKSIIS